MNERTQPTPQVSLEGNSPRNRGHSSIPCLAARVGSQMQPVGTRGWQPWFCGGFSLLHSLLPSGCGLDLASDLGDEAVLAGEQPVERHPQVRQEMEAICHLHRSRCGLLSGFGVGTTAISTDEGDSWMST